MNSYSSTLWFVCSCLVTACADDAASTERLPEEDLSSVSSETWGGYKVDTSFTNGGVIYMSIDLQTSPFVIHNACSGVIYKSKYILTAKHCFGGKSLNEISSILFPNDSINTYSKISTGKLISQSIKKIHYPPSGADLALVELTSPYKQNGKIFDSKIVLSKLSPGQLADMSTASNFSEILRCYGYGADPIYNDMSAGKLRVVPFSVFKAKSYQDYAEEYEKLYPNKKFDLPICETSPQAIGIECNWEKNIDQKHFTVVGDSGGPCVLENSDWQTKNEKITKLDLVKPRELVGVHFGAMSRVDAKPSNVTDVIMKGVAFSTNVAAHRKWIESVTLGSGGVSTKKSPGPGKQGYIWFGDVDGDFVADHITVGNTFVSIGINNGQNAFGIPKEIPFPFSMNSDYIYVNYLNGDYFSDFLYMDGDTITSLFTEVTPSSFQIAPQLPIDLPSLPSGSWTQGDPVWLDYVESPVFPSLIRIAENKIVVVPNKDGLFDVSSTKYSSLNLPSGCDYKSSNNSFALFFKDEWYDMVFFCDKFIVVKNGTSLGQFEAENTFYLQEDCGSESKKMLLDMNNDGHVDYVCIDRMEAKVMFWDSLGSKFGPPVSSTFEFASDWNKRAVLIDRNFDSIPDIVFTDSTASWLYLGKYSPVSKIPQFDESIYIKFGSSSGEFSDAKKNPIKSFTPSGIHNFAMGDLNGDGISEIVSTSVGQKEIVVYDPYFLQFGVFK